MPRCPFQESPWLAALLELSDAGVAVLDPGLRIVAWNSRAEAIVGWPAEHVVGKNIGAVLGLPTDRSDGLRSYLEGGQTQRYQRLNARRKGGLGLRLSVSARSVRDEGRLAGYVLQFHDDASAAMPDEFRKFFQAVEQSMVGALIADPNGRIEYANPRASEILGRSPLELIGTYFVGSGNDIFRCPLFLTGEAAGLDWRGEVVSGSGNGARVFNVATSAIRDAGGDLANRVALFEEITAHRVLQNAERELRDSLAHSGRLAAIGEMASVIAHEVNQPLAAIANFARGCVRRLDSGQWEAEPLTVALREIVGQVERAAAIVNNVRGFVRRDVAQHVAVDLGELLAQLNPLFRVQGKTHGARVEIQIEDNLPAVLADATQIGQVVLNLVKNGLEAMSETPPEQRLLSLQVRRAGPTRIVISIADRGCGIDDAVIARLGEPFFSTKPEGLGLGLSITRGLVEAHGGHLEIIRHAERGEAGTTFSFTLSAANP